VPLSAQRAGLPDPRTDRYFVNAIWAEDRAPILPAGSPCLPARHGDLHCHAIGAVLHFPLRQALDRVDAQLDLLIYETFPLPKPVETLTLS
jgi:hypothetical protein